MIISLLHSKQSLFVFFFNSLLFITIAKPNTTIDKWINPKCTLPFGISLMYKTASISNPCFHNNRIDQATKQKTYNNITIICQDQKFGANPSPQNPLGGCQAYVKLEASASTEIPCLAGRSLNWSVLIDRWGDGTFDYEYSSNVHNNDLDFSNDTNKNGIPDQYVAPTSNGDPVIIPTFLMDHWQGVHKVLWTVSDACGNTATCSSNFAVADKKAPTPYCISFSSALDQNNQVELWAIDFNKGSFDNCTPQKELLFTFDGKQPIASKIKEEHFFKEAGVEATEEEYIVGNAQRWQPAYRSTSKIFRLIGVLDVNMSVWDKDWNTDFCKVTVSPVCGIGFGSVAGNLSTIYGKPINKVNIRVNANVPEFPQFATFDGIYYFSTKDVADYTIVPTKIDDYTNGISSIDLIMLQRHLLGTAKLNSPEQLIAADVNRDGMITNDDLKELRQLHEGMVEKFSNNDSWAFIPKSYVYQDATNPFNAPRTITINVGDHIKNLDFIGIKIGDLNLDASTSVKVFSNGLRSSSELKF